MKKLNVKCYYKYSVKLVWSKQASCAVLNDHQITKKKIRGRRKLFHLSFNTFLSSCLSFKNVKAHIYRSQYVVRCRNNHHFFR